MIFYPMDNTLDETGVILPLPPNDLYPFTTSAIFHELPIITRQFFYWIILIISVFAIIGNLLAIRSMTERKTKFLQKSCILALSISDIFTVVLFSMNFLDMLSKQYIDWTLGEFLCNFIPFGQVFGTTASSLLLLIIALDRYQNVIQTFSKTRWDPKPCTCILTILFLFVICGVISYPMYTAFLHEQMWVLMLPFTDKAVYQIHALCVSPKNRLSAYYIALDVLIFLPMLTVFIWFYLKIAALIWMHRKPVTSKFNKFEKDLEDSTSGSTKTTNVASSNISIISQNKPKKMKNLQVQKKIRTFRIVLVLVLSFVLCRFPYWFYYTIRLLGKCSSKTSWNLHFSLVSLNLFNCVLNPLLYTFLNQTITALRMFRDFLWKVCCCCCSSDEFEEFEKENPFANDQIQPACGTVKARVRVDKVRFDEKNKKTVQKY